jgi:hypothetical protein
MLYVRHLASWPLLAMAASELFGLFKDLSGSCERLFRLLGEEERQLALLLIRASFIQPDMDKPGLHDVATSEVVMMESPEEPMEEVNVTTETENISSEKLDGSQMIGNQNQTMLRRLECDKCDYQTFKKYNLKQHMKNNHLSVESQLYQCETCKYQTKRPDELKQHMAIYHAQEILKCELCDYETTNSDNLKLHVDSKHTNENQINQEELKKVIQALSPLPFAEAKQYLVQQLASWKERGLQACPVLAAGLLQLGWHLQGFNGQPACNHQGRARLREMFK